MAGLGGDLLGVDKAIAAHPHAVVRLRQVGDQVSPALVGHHHLGEAGAEVARFGDDPDAGFRAEPAGHDAADRLVVDPHVLGCGRLRRAGGPLRGQAIFFGKGQCGTCHTPPYYTDNLMHNLRTERFYKPVLINGAMASADGPIKTFPLRGVKDSPPYLHDGRLLTLEDTVEFFNLVLADKLTAAEKQDLVAFLRAL